MVTEVSIEVLLLLTMVISWILKTETQNPLTKRKKVINIISKITFWITCFLCFPILTSLYVIYHILDKFGLLDILSDFFSSIDTSTYTSNYNVNDFEYEDNYTYTPETKYCHYNDSKVSTIYNNGTVIRDDGMCGFRNGDYVYFNDGSTGHIVMLDDENGIIE